MANNVDLGYFPFSWHKKFIFHFLSAKNGIFYEAPTKNELQKWT
jgi:hypothetical protein